MKDSTRKVRRKHPYILGALSMLLAFGLNLVLMLGVGLNLMNDDNYRRILIWSADHILDSRLEIDGAFSFRLGHEVQLKAETVRLKANDGSYDLSVGKLDVEQRLSSYLTTGKLWFNHLRMEGLSGEIKETGAGDEFDWKDLSLPFLVIEEVQIRDLSLAYLERDQQRHSFELGYILLDDTDNRGPVKVSASGEINARPLRLEGTLGSLKQLRSNDQTYPVDIILSSDTGAVEQDRQIIELAGTVGHTLPGNRLLEATFDLDIPELAPIFNDGIDADKLGHIQGSIDIVEAGSRWRIRKIQFAATDTEVYQLRVDGAVDETGQFDLHSEFGVTDPAAFGTRFGIDLPGYAAFKGKGLVSGNRNRLDYQGKMSIGRIQSDASLNVSLVGGKPGIAGKIVIPEFYLADVGIDHRLGPGAGGSVKKGDDTGTVASPREPAAEQTLFDRAPLDFTPLQHFNLDLDVAVEKIRGLDYSSGGLAGKFRLTDGSLRISPLQMTFEGGTADLEIALDTRDKPSIKLRLTAEDLMPGRLLTQLAREMPVNGRVKLNMDINSQGGSVHELVSAVEGKVNLDMENVSLPRNYLDYLSTDIEEQAATGDDDARIEIDGAFTFDFGSETGLVAEAIRVTGDDGSYALTLGKLDLQPDLAAYLEKGKLRIHKLNISDLHAEITTIGAWEEHELPEHDWHEFDWQVTHWPFVLIEEMQLSNLLLIYTQDDEQDTVKLDSLVLDNKNSDRPMLINATGAVNAEILKVEARVGTTEQPRGKKQVYPIDVSLSHGNSDAAPDSPVIRLVGSIDRTRSDSSLMEASIDVAVNELVAIVNGKRTADRMGRIQGNVSVADADGRWRIRKINLDSSDTELYQWRLHGSVDDSDKLELRSEGEVPDPAAFGAQLGIDLTGYGAYKARGSITGTRSKITYLSYGTIGRTDSEMTLSVSLVDGKPLIQGKFVTPNLYLTDIGLAGYLGVNPDAPDTTANPHIGEQTTPEELVPDTADGQTVFSREPLDFSALRHFNLDLEITIDDVTGVDFSIEKLDGRIRLNDGVLSLSPVRLGIEGGTTFLELELDARGTPSVSLKVMADDLLLETLVARMQQEVQVKGKAHLNVDISSSGHSAHELASELSGKLSFALENARVPKKYIEFLTADLFGFLFRSVTFEDSYTTLSCVLTGIEIDQGVATTRLLFGEGNRLAVEGTATVDLGQETIDVVLLPKSKKRIGLDYSRITMKGSLKNPDVEATGTKAATVTAVGGVLLVPQIVVPVFLIEQVWKAFSSDDDTGCSNYVEEHQDEIEAFQNK
ncbi:MAG: AsmA family protein [Gammaproteobacteria bacterium]|nr:MAG: AsmA family protein [Gammaproteobacteria bacterium]